VKPEEKVTRPCGRSSGSVVRVGRAAGVLTEALRTVQPPDRLEAVDFFLWYPVSAGAFTLGRSGNRGPSAGDVKIQRLL
jgi:hypothetical protein